MKPLEEEVHYKAHEGLTGTSAGSYWTGLVGAKLYFCLISIMQEPVRDASFQALPAPKERVTLRVGPIDIYFQ